MTDLMLERVDGSVEAVLAEPTDPSAEVPGVLLYMDAIGLRDQIRRIAERIASWGYVVLAPNTFYRSGSAAETSPSTDLRLPGAREAYFAEVGPRMSALTSDLSRADTQTYLAALASQRWCAPTPVAVVGYCMGVRLALRAAGDHPDKVATVAGFHGGGLVTDAPDSPHRSLESTRAEVLLRHADRDPSMTAEHMDVLARSAEEHGVALDQLVYEGAPHGYAMADTSMYDERAAERHFRELRAKLAATLG